MGKALNDEKVVGSNHGQVIVEALKIAAQVVKGTAQQLFIAVPV